MQQQSTEAHTPVAKGHTLSCTTCRSRKVRCDHRKPVCSGCEKHGEECVWPERRKNSTRREKRLYQNIVARLAQMEHFVQELQGQEPARTSSSPRRRPPAPDSSSAGDVPKFPAGIPAGPTTSYSISPEQTTRSTPSPASSSPKAARLYYSGAASEGTIGMAGSSSLFSIEGIAKIDALVGDARFSDAVQVLYRRIGSAAPRRSIDYAASERNYPFPTNDVVIRCVNDFFQTVNRGYMVLQESEVRIAVQAYLYGRPPPGIGWRMALNVVLLHSLRKQDWLSNSREHEKYLHNALALIPHAILQTPNPMTIGALLSLTSYFTFTGENHIAVSILALAAQFILLAGYHNPNHPCALADDLRDDPEARLHRRRLFWTAYLLDHSLMLLIGKPPLIADEFLLDLPDECPPDSYGVYFFPGDVVLSYFRERVRLARIQGRVYSRLYSNRGGTTAAALESEISVLDAELQEWREGIPELARPAEESLGVGGAEMSDGDLRRFLSLSILHFSYFQLVVAVHSAAFRLPPPEDEDEAEGVRPSVALCVNAARAAISLLRYQQLQHPFTIYLLYQVAWSVDILFVNILENRTSPEAHCDLALLRTVLDYFETLDPRREQVASYHVVKALCEVASSVVVDGSPGSSTGEAMTPECASVFGSMGVSVPTDPSSVMSPELDMGGYWGNISFSGHDWLSSGFLQTTDMNVPMGSTYTGPVVGGRG
ncbi:fungal specific transcription factor [Colletotrichum plurivorum]|uniref:Fungal specific transcription factor n=1 Tax=Colletotrichum plurivorum TaxID=2175906 RepID=A0A8H6N631_9PEZI|nr:fungal specific transcription factor [Colletotrichum plurivorum]